MTIEERHKARLIHPTQGGPDRIGNGAPPWRARDPLLALRRRASDQFEDTQKRVKKALDKSYQGEVLSDQQLRVIAQTVLLDTPGDSTHASRSSAEPGRT